MIFVMNENEAQDDGAIHTAWEDFLNQEEGKMSGTCLVTGKKMKLQESIRR